LHDEQHLAPSTTKIPLTYSHKHLVLDQTCCSPQRVFFVFM
jgi:hypothetical protein